MPEDYIVKYYQWHIHLLTYKNVLLKRDKGKAQNYVFLVCVLEELGNAFNQGKKLLIPYMAEKGIAVKCLDEKMFILLWLCDILRQ